MHRFGHRRRANAESVSAAILCRLKADAELTLGEPVTDAVITVPANSKNAAMTRYHVVRPGI